MGCEVHLDIYNDRIAITSPGGMYNGQRVQDVPIDEISSERRNPILADVMAQLDYMEKRGSGLKRICKETKALEGYKDELKPVFKSSPSQFMTVIFSTRFVNGDAKETLSETLKETLSGTLSDTLNLIRGNPGITRNDLMNRLNLVAATISRHIDALKERGLIERRGGKKYGGYYPL